MSLTARSGFSNVRNLLAASRCPSYTPAMGGWEIDFRRLYGWWGWRRRARFRLTEAVFEAPDGDVCVAFYHIGEISLAGSVGRLAVFKNKRDPRRIFNGAGALYWYWGEGSVRWSRDGGRVFISRCEESGGWPGGNPRRLDSFLTVLDVQRELWAGSSHRLDDLQALQGLDDDVITVDGSPRSAGQRLEQVHLSRLDWRRFRWH